VLQLAGAHKSCQNAFYAVAVKFPNGTDHSRCAPRSYLEPNSVVCAEGHCFSRN